MKQVTILLSDRTKTNFMQSFDVFERHKVLVGALMQATVVDDFGDSHVSAIQRECESGPCELVAVFDSEKTYYRDPSVKVISDGQRCSLLDDLLTNQPKESP
jgi:hypothetical protein